MESYTCMVRSVCVWVCGCVGGYAGRGLLDPHRDRFDGKTELELLTHYSTPTHPVGSQKLNALTTILMFYTRILLSVMHPNGISGLESKHVHKWIFTIILFITAKQLET